MKDAPRLVLWLGIILQASSYVGQAAPSEPAAVDAASPSDQFYELAERYWTIVTERPQRGTALDLWFQHYLDAGRLTELINRVEGFASNNPRAANAQLLLGLVRERQGKEAEAEQAYRQAERLAPKNYVPLLLRGSLLARQEHTAAAAETLTKAIQLDPPKAAFLDACKQLGRLQLRLGRREEALRTWSQLAATFPEDVRVQAELATLLADERQYEPAVLYWRRVETLSSDDPYETLRARLAIADIESKLGHRAHALTLLAAALDSVDPESWVAQDVLRRVEAVFEGEENADAWIEWCRARQTKRPRDLSTLLTLARALSEHGRHDEALERFRHAVELAPSRRDVREDLIHELERNGEWPAALSECEVLVEQHPGDAELLLKLGRLYISAENDDGRDARRRAAETWRRIAAIRPDDPLLALRTAETCQRSARIARVLKSSEEPMPSAVKDGAPSHLLAVAEEFYREALRRSGDAPDYLEYLGEFLHSTGRSEEAVAVWSRVAKGSHDTAASWHRLADVYGNFGYATQAVEAARQAVTRKPDEFALRASLIEHLLHVEEFNAALAELPELHRLAEVPELEVAALRLSVDVYESAGTIDRTIVELERRAVQERTRRDDWLLGLLLAKRERWDAASYRFETALARYPGDRIALVIDYADVLQRSGKHAIALEQFRRLAQIDKRGRTSYFERIVDLELRLGRNAQALAAVEELIQLVPSNVEAYLLKASVSRRLDRLETAVDALRRAVKLDPGNIETRSELARTLADVRRPHEAIEHYWRCLELSDDTSQRLSITVALAELAEDHNRSQQLVARLRRLRERQMDRKPVTLCIAQALRHADRLDEVTQELKALLAERPVDFDVLTALQEVAAEKEDWRAATAWQKRVVQINGGTEQLEILADLLGRAGDYDAAGRIWRQILIQTDDDRTLADAAAVRWRRGDVDGAVALAEAGSVESWRLRLLAGTFRMAINDVESAIEHFEAILDMADEASAGASNLRVVGIGVTGGRGTHQVYSPESVDLHTAASAYGNFKKIVVAAATVRREEQMTVEPKLVREAYRFFDTELRRAKIGAASALAAIAETRTLGDRWLQLQRTDGEPDLDLLRLFVAVYGATGRLAQIDDRVAQLEAARPDDPMPHLARLHRVSARNYRALNSERRNREVAALIDSFEWLKKHQPEVVPLVAHNYLTGLVSLGQSRQAGTDLLRELDSAHSIADLSTVIELAFEIGSAELHQEFLYKSAALAETSPPTTASADAIAALISAALRSTRAPDRTPAQIDAVLALADRYLTITAPRQLTSTIQAGTSRINSLRGRRVNRVWRLHYSTLRFGNGKVQLRVEVSPFPPMNPLLDGMRYNTLRLVVSSLPRDTDILIGRLQRRMEASSGVVADSFRMAQTCALWWTGHTDEAARKLDDLCTAHPQNDGLRMVQAIGLINSDRTADALRALDVVASTGPMAADATNLRHAALATSMQGDPQQLAAALSIELQAPREPTLGPFFGRALPANPGSRSSRGRASVTVAGGENLAGTQWNSTPIDRLRDALWRPDSSSLTEDDPLPGLIDTVQRQHERYPANSELSVLLAVLELAAGRIEDAKQSVVRWQYLVQRRQDLLDSPEARVLIRASLQRDESRELGETLARRTLIATAMGTAYASRDEELQAKLAGIVSDWSTAIGGDASPQRKRLFTQQLVNDIESISATTTRRAPGSLATYRLGRLCIALHPGFLPDALELLAKRASKHIDELSDFDRFGRELHFAVQRSLPRLQPSEQQRVLDALTDLLFAHGNKQEPVLFAWWRASSKLEPGSLGQTAISLAQDLNQLERLREEWRAHPLADGLPMLCLRAEAAVAAGENQLADELIAQTNVLAATSQQQPQLWSRYCRSRVYRDHDAAEWVLTLGGGASVRVEPGGRLRNIANLSREKVVVKDIRLIALTQVTDEELERFRELHALETLSLSYTRVTDGGLVHLSELPELRVLRLSGTQITDAGLEHLRGLSSLRSLLLQNTKVTEAGAERLREALPDCTIDL